MTATEGSALSETQLSEAEVKAVLEKAVQIERQGASSVSEVTEAGREAGISHSALLAAVAQVLAERGGTAPVTAPAVDAIPVSHWPKWLTAAGWAAAGALAGALAGGLVPESLAVLAFGLLGIGIGIRAFDHRRDRSFRQYEIEATLGWGSWAAAALLSGGRGQEDVVAGFAIMWSVFSAGGAAIIATKRRPQLPAPTPALPVETSPTIRSPDPE